MVYLFEEIGPSRNEEAKIVVSKFRNGYLRNLVDMSSFS